MTGQFTSLEGNHLNANEPEFIKPGFIKSELNDLIFNVVIPARYASTRLPAKPLIEIAGKTMLQHTYESACLSGAENIIIATDDQRIVDSAKHYTDDVLLTSRQHQSGTDRLSEVVEKLSWDDQSIVVNVQGDEPLILAEHIHQVAQALKEHEQAGISTLRYQIDDIEELLDPNVVKVVCDKKEFALYFSRAPIPWSRDNFSLPSIEDTIAESGQYYRHIGLYAYRTSTLKKFKNLSPTPIEKIESLEQLRALYYGIKIIVSETQKKPGHGVDVLEDVKKVEQIIRNRSYSSDKKD